MAHRFDPKKVDKLVNSERRKLLPPNEILAHLSIQQLDDVADIGCGPGFFTIPAAKITVGTVYGVDVEPQMLHFLREEAEKEAVSNIKTVQSDAEHIDLADNSADKVFYAFILHEVGNLAQALAEMKRILRPSGKVLILEWEKKLTESGPPVDERLEATELKIELQQIGFKTTIMRPNPNHYMILCES